ncbi:hypothetical protein Patl1_25594 [Pistacia atlantica]|uniref:Uncharacterized protein n=1 Tax=Pistacia atlantica TaxID=434234 RepID=A0ACC1B4G5_9ROSI|nr:hypothetical protein Patl1_25594 [Pistacia atlantica]
MEVSVKSIALSMVLVTVVTSAWRILNWVWLRPKRLERYLRQQGLKGKPYRLLYGDLKETSMMITQAKSRPFNLSDDIAPRVIPFLHKVVQDYGKNSFIWLSRVTITNPDQIKEIFTRYNDFYKPQANPLSKLLVNGSLNLEGEEWAKRRKIINPAFHLEKLKLMLPAFYQAFNETISKWENLVSAEGSCEMKNWAQCFDNFTMHKCRLLPTKRNKRLKEIDQEIRAVLIGIIKNREKAIKTSEATNSDLLSILLELNFREIEEHGNNKNVGMTIDDVIEECKLFYFARHDTSSVLLVWTMVLLSKHQNWQARAREEVLQVFGDKKPNYEGLNQLKVVSVAVYFVLWYK